MTKTKTQEQKIAFLIEMAERRDWRVIEDGEGFEFMQYSPAGEDFGFYVQATTAEQLRDGIVEYYEYFDAEEHAASWYGQNGATGLHELIEDADAIEGMLEDLAITITQAMSFSDALRALKEADND